MFRPPHQYSGQNSHLKREIKFYKNVYFMPETVYKIYSRRSEEQVKFGECC